MWQYTGRRPAGCAWVGWGWGGPRAGRTGSGGRSPGTWPAARGTGCTWTGPPSTRGTSKDVNLKIAHKNLLVYTVKKVSGFSLPPPGCHLPNSPWRGILKLIFARESLVRDIPALEGKTANLFYSVGAPAYIFVLDRWSCTKTCVFQRIWLKISSYSLQKIQHISVKLQSINYCFIYSTVYIIYTYIL